MNFGENLKSIRKQKKISQEELAEKLGVSRQSISKWETGENYPSMTNIMCLTDIFHCKINDLVHEDMNDIDSLDQEIKMKVVKLKQKEQKRMKLISKVLSIIAMIGKIGVRIAIVAVAFLMIFLPIIFADIKYKNNELTFNNMSTDKITFVEENNHLDIKVNNEKIDEHIDEETLSKIKEAFDKNDKWKIVGVLETGFAMLIVYLVFISIILKSTEKLFKNINKGETPFTSVNVKLIKKIAYFMIASIIVSGIGQGIFSLLISDAFESGFSSFSLIEILFLFGMAYIFEYGVEIQKDSEGKMYDE